jgi:hypothetical protein
VAMKVAIKMHRVNRIVIMNDTNTGVRRRRRRRERKARRQGVCLDLLCLFIKHTFHYVVYRSDKERDKDKKRSMRDDSKSDKRRSSDQHRDGDDDRKRRRRSEDRDRCVY